MLPRKSDVSFPPNPIEQTPALQAFSAKAAMNARIRKAVFPVAGLGTRFLPATKVMP